MKTRLAAAMGLAALIAVTLTSCTGTDVKEPTTSPPASSSSPTPSETPSPSPSATPTESAPATSTSDAPTPPVETSAPPAALKATAVIVLAAFDSSNERMVLGGYVEGLVENGGTCTFTLAASSGAVVAQWQDEGIADATTTSCSPSPVDASSLPNATYSVTLTYSNATGETTSQQVTVEVKR